MSRLVTLTVVAAACRASPPVEDRAQGAVLRFADGAQLGAVRVDPGRTRPGGWVEVSWEQRGGDSDAVTEVGWVSTIAVARQQSYRDRNDGPVDPLAVWVPVTGAERPVARLLVPVAQRTEDAVLAVRRILGGRTLAVVDGPGVQGELGVLAAVGVDVGTPSFRVAGLPMPPVVDGDLEELSAVGEPLTLVESLDGEAVERPTTTVFLGWDRDALYVAADLEDEDVWAPHLRRDDPLYRAEAFEVFVAADGSGTDYLEYEVSARNVVFDAAFRRHREGDTGFDGTIRTATAVVGSLDDRDDRDQGWTVEIAIPWSELCERTRITCPPVPGLRFRANVFRLEHGKKSGQRGFALAPTRVPDFHAWAAAAVLELAP